MEPRSSSQGNGTKSREAEKLKQAIARNEVEIGMPQEAVDQILGKPKAKSLIKDANGTFEQWTYTLV